MFSRLRIQAFIIAALGASKVCAVIMAFPPSGTTLQRGIQLDNDLERNKHCVIRYRSGKYTIPIVNNVDAQSFKTTITLPTSALGKYTLAFLSNETFAFIAGNQVNIVDDTSLSTTSSNSTTRSATGLPGSPSTTSTQVATTPRTTSLPIGAILGIVFGVVITLVILTIFLVLRARRKRPAEANLDPFTRIHTDENKIQRPPPSTMHQTKGLVSNAVDGQAYLSMQLHTLQKQLEDLRGAVDHGPDRAAEQNEILQERIRMLQRELEARGGVEPPPGYLDHN
ncbi:hypothetical protein MVEN_01178400 [Mycena venus]|uniref:Transmembrane protein n=1 Tax=Mycena venus TaxID=2733690 RepID=A0A8H7CXU1_9AGAR|nr:hypothetical protein MVEN_01178400 [Mycena venus]